MLPVEDFPDISAGEFTHSFSMATGEIRKLIEHTQFAISTEETRYYLNGIFLHTVEEDGDTLLRAVATDGHRLARSQISAPDGAAGMPGIIVPRKTVGEIQRLVEDPDAAVHVQLSDTKIRLSVGETILTSKLIDGTFPDYNRVIPTGNDKELKLDRSTFARAVDRVSTISSERGRAVKLQLSEGQMVLSVNNPDSGTAEEEIAVGYSADALDIGFNSRYLLDITNQLSGDEVKFMLSDPGSPTLIHDSVNDGAIYVLMPMRV
jgi:DNA polymerase-3 subunit beta